jgi:phospholipid/cholesterol/gamma-HCH transport system substrate-binding protein
MESRVNYIIVGIFVLLFTIGMLMFVFWLGKYGGSDEYVYYKAYMTESVSGLSREASVKYRGVEVGIVEKVEIDPQNSEQVALLLKVKKDTPIKEDMSVTMKFYGLTGLAFIEIGGGSKSSPLLMQKGNEIPVIQAAPSVFARLDESLSTLAEKLTHTLDSMDELFSKNNIENVSVALSNVKEFTTAINNFKGDIQGLMEKSVHMEDKIIRASEKVASASDGVKNVARALEQGIMRGDYDFKSITSKSLEKFDDLLGSLKVLTGEIEEAVISIKNSPGDLLFKQTEQRLGPGEKTQ